MKLVCHTSCSKHISVGKRKEFRRGRYQCPRSVWPIFIVSEAFQRYFKVTLITKAQTFWEKRKVVKMYILSHFLFSSLLGTYKLGISPTKDSGGLVLC